ncbi:PREDICTED: serine/threonine-protein phosphatase 7 long form homolog [Nicotiana attenuata]|uniref:serine/threonine-protein phosphatase 7 long form homolog n=1 Tax=Nicotiana attenuata TaxID=49451 RepID=UPI00090487D9|nr:PREDICTED: serine/threonine-protein phosphatase 7 long form homolog [Nicotiana attenuata]
MAFPPPAHPGPAEDQLLVLQGDHRSSFVWEGQLSEQPLRPRRPDDLWEFIAENPFHGRIVERLQATGFYTIIQLGRMQLDWSLITALVERWRLETHTFHLPTGEATITFEDVQVLYGLRVDGRAVALPHYIRGMTRAQFLDMMGEFTSFRPEGGAGGSRVLLSAIRDQIVFLHPDIHGETEDIWIKRYTRLALLLLFGCVLFPDTSGSRVTMRFLHYLQQLDELPQYSWGSAILAYLYRSMCRASIGPAVDICGFLPLLQVWALQWIMPLQPPLPPLPPSEAYPFLPLAVRWILRRGNYRGSDAHHNLPLVRDVLNMLVDGQFIWTPYSVELVAQLPACCSVDRLLWSTSVPMIFFDHVEYHATKRVLRQFHRPQPIPREPGWEVTHYQRDDRGSMDQRYMGWLQQQIVYWEERVERIPPPPTFTQEATVHLYTEWYRRHTRLMIGNPIHILDERYRPYAGRLEALAIGHHQLFQLGQQMQQRADIPEVVEYGRQVAQLARRTLLQARDAARLDREAQGRRGGGPQQWGGEAPVDPHAEGQDEDFGVEALGDDQQGYIPQADEPSSSMSSYSLQLSLPASQVTPSGALSITGTFDGDVEQYFGCPSTAAEDRSTRDVDGGRSLRPSPCDDEHTTDAYTQEVDETMVADGPTAYSSDPASCSVDTAAHPHIKRRLDDDDPDSVPGRQGMRLRPTAALKHTGCDTH